MKKNPYVMTIGFKKEDPEHVRVANLLNSMERGKAQFIVKAVMLYQNMQDSGELSAGGMATYDYEKIRKIVLQVMDERDRLLGRTITGGALPDAEEKKEDDILDDLDAAALDGIMASITAFQGS